MSWFFHKVREQWKPVASERNVANIISQALWKLIKYITMYIYIFIYIFNKILNEIIMYRMKFESKLII